MFENQLFFKTELIQVGISYYLRTLMINFILKDILTYRVEIPVCWLVGVVFVVYKLGFQTARRKYQGEKICIKNYSTCIVPYSPSKRQQHKISEEQISDNLNSTQKEGMVEISFQKAKVLDQSEKCKQIKQKEQFISHELLKEKVQLQMTKLQSTSFLQIRIEPSSDSKFLRKVQKLELVTDYEMQPNDKMQQQIVPFKTTPVTTLSQPNSYLQVVAHQDYTMKLMSPSLQKKFINLNYLSQFSKQQQVTSYLTETGRFHKFFRKAKRVGKGGFGSVFRAWNIFDEKEYAIKKIIVDGSIRLNQLLREVSIISRSNHPNIVLYYNCWLELASLDQIHQVSGMLSARIIQKQQKDELESLNYVSSDSGVVFERESKNKINYSESQKNGLKQLVLHDNFKKQKPVDLIHVCTLHIQMQICEGSLYEYLRRGENIKYSIAFQIMGQLLVGLEFLHSNGIVHRDLKPANILLCNGGRRVKIGDFGLATLIQYNSEQVIRHKVGTPLYMAPELNQSSPVPRQYMHLVDIYSVGVIYYELLNDLNLCTQHQRHQKINSLQRNVVAMSLKQLKQQKKFIKLLTKPASIRPSISQVLQSCEFKALKMKYLI